TSMQRRTALESLNAFESMAAQSGKMARYPVQAGVVRSMNEVPSILSAIEAGDPHAASRLAAEKPGQTLQPTALVHEAYLRLVEDVRPRAWNGRVHFFAATPSLDEDLLDLDDALTRLAEADPAATELVKLRYFAGLSIPQAAEALGVGAARGLAIDRPLSGW